MGLSRRIESAPEGRKKSIPQVFLVVGRVVLLEKGQELFLKRVLLVMFFLAGDVFRNGADARFANAEDCIASLPGKIRAPFLVDPT